MNQKLSDWASIAEVVSSVAVVITLVFLVLGIRENTATTRAEVYANLIDSINELESQRLGDTELDAHWRLFRNGQASTLDEDDYRQLTQYSMILARNYEKAYYSHVYGIIGANEWERFELAICRLYSDAQRAGFGPFDPDSTGISANFRDFVVRTCGE